MGGNQIDAHLSEKFSIGVNLPYTPEKRLENIVGFHYSAVGQAHFPSLVDIILGSVRFAINAHTRNLETHLETSKRILQIVAPLFYRDREGSPVSELSCIFSPKVIGVGTYREKYQSLKSFLENAGIDTEQQITAERRY